MASNKHKFQLRTDYIHTFEKLSDIEAGKLVKHLFKYVNGSDEDLDVVHDDRLIEIIFEPIKRDLKNDLIKWRKTCERNGEKSRAYWDKQKKSQTNPTDTQRDKKQSNGHPTLSDKDLDKDKDKDKDKINYKEGVKNLFENKFLKKSFLNSLRFFDDVDKPKTDKQKFDWVDCFDKLNRIDGLELSEIEKIIEFGRTDSFWKANFLSIVSLRKKKAGEPAKWRKIQSQIKSKPVIRKDSHRPPRS